VPLRPCRTPGPWAPPEHATAGSVAERSGVSFLSRGLGESDSLDTISPTPWSKNAADEPLQNRDVQKF